MFITKSVVNIFNRHFACKQGNTFLNKASWIFRFEGQGSITWVKLVFGSMPKLKSHFFQNKAMLHIKLKGNEAYNNMLENIFPFTHLIPGMGSKGHIF